MNDGLGQAIVDFRWIVEFRFFSHEQKDFFGRNQAGGGIALRLLLP